MGRAIHRNFRRRPIKKIILGNIYRPPKDIKNDYKTFIDELNQVISQLGEGIEDCLICGDFNINLLKLFDREIISEFFDMFSSHSYFPKITLPTRFSQRSCTLIDIIFSKLSSNSINCTN